MRITRPVACLAVTASLFGASVASAAVKKPVVKPVCNLLTDDKADASFLGAAPNDGNLDIVSADIASDAKTMTAVLRLASYSETDLQAPLGRGYYVKFNAPGLDTPIYFNFQITPDVQAYEWGVQEVLATGNGSYAQKGTATGFIPPTGEIHISVPVSEVGSVGKVKPGAKLTNLTASSTMVLGTSVTGGLVSTVDDAAATKSYIAGQLSCVKPGK
jgi:hypothetical protein